MQNKIIYFISILIVQTFYCAELLVGHPGEHRSIQLLTEEISENKQNADLYLRRGQQHRLAGHFESAIIDFVQAEKLDSENNLVDLYRGQLFLDFGWYASSEYYLNRFLKYSPTSITALISLARALSFQKKGKQASEIYSRTLEIVPKPSPEFYNEMSDSYMIDKNFSEAVRILDEGISNLGKSTFLEEKALGIELNNQMYDDALRRIDRLLQYSPQIEKWLYRKGQIFESLGRYDEAREAYISALNNLGSRPSNKRKIRALSELEKEIKKSLDRIGQR